MDECLAISLHTARKYINVPCIYFHAIFNKAKTWATISHFYCALSQVISLLTYLHACPLTYINTVTSAHAAQHTAGPEGDGHLTLNPETLHLGLTEVTGVTMSWCQKSYPATDININIVILSSWSASPWLRWLSHPDFMRQHRSGGQIPSIGLDSSLEFSRCLNRTISKSSLDSTAAGQNLWNNLLFVSCKQMTVIKCRHNSFFSLLFMVGAARWHLTHLHSHTGLFLLLIVVFLQIVFFVVYAGMKQHGSLTDEHVFLVMLNASD